MPDTDPTTDAPATEPGYTFPFTVPTDLASATDAELAGLLGEIRGHGATLAAVAPATDDSVAGLRACRDLAIAAVNEVNARTDRANEAAELAAELASVDVPTPGDGDPEGDAADGGADGPEPTAPAEPAEPAADPAAVTAASPRRPIPRVRAVAQRTGSTPQVPRDQATGAYSTMHAAISEAGIQAGAVINFGDAVRIMSRLADRNPATTASRAAAGWSKGKRPITVYDANSPGRKLQLRDYSRTSGVEIRHQFPDDLRVREGGPEGEAVARHAASERRLPGGSLLNSASEAVKRGKALTAAAAWCAPSETMYQLLEMESEDGVLSVPELQSSRGGWNIPINGGPDFASIYEGLGSAGYAHLTEADVIADTVKVATEIPCPDFEEVRLGVDYLSITGSLLQRRGYPEAVERFTRAAMVGLTHKLNQGFINAIVAGSGSVITIPSDPSGDDAASALLAAIELAITDAKYRERMGLNTTMEVVLPWWILQQIRAGLSRRTAVALMNVTDAMIMEWFAQRRAAVQLVYDWQDAASGLAGGPGAATPLTRLPATVDFLVYPAGTWVKAVQDVVDLSTIYDSTLLQTNQFTAIFAETGWAALKMSPISRRYRVPVDPSGVVGCCDPVGS